MRFSIIVPVYNTEKFLPECIDSVLAQRDAPEYELILVDDGSTDASGKICDKYALEHENIHVIHTENQGICNARNTGMSAAAGEYILFLDSDDMWENRLLRTADHLCEYATDMISFNLCAMSEDGRNKQALQPDLLPEGESGMAYLKRLFSSSKVPMVYVWRTVYRREFLLENSFLFDTMLQTSEDFDFNMRCYRACKKIVGTAESLYCYRTRAGSLARTYSKKKLMSNLINKAYWYRQMPETALADLFVSQILILPLLPPDTDMADINMYINANADIISASAHPNYRLAKLLFRAFGYRRGAVMYCGIRDFAQRLRKGKN